MAFRDRRDAGQKLGHRLMNYRKDDVVVLAVPRGGVVVGYEVAKVLDTPLDVIVPRKLGAPDEPELAIGAVASWGDHDQVLDDQTIRMLHVPRDYIEQEIKRQMEEIQRRLLAYRGTTEPPETKGKTVILVDDGIATGATLMAAVLALKHLKPKRIVLAVPVAPPEAYARFRNLVDDYVVLESPSPFFAVGAWYEVFEQTSDQEVVDLLRDRSYVKQQ